MKRVVGQGREGLERAATILSRASGTSRAAGITHGVPYVAASVAAPHLRHDDDLVAAVARPDLVGTLAADREMRLYGSQSRTSPVPAAQWEPNNALAINCCTDQVEHVRYNLRRRIIGNDVTVVISKPVTRRRRWNVAVV